MNGKRSKQCRRAAARLNMDKDAMKKLYLQKKRNRGAVSVSKTPAAPSGNAPVKFLGFSVSDNRTMEQSFNAPHQLHPNKYWHTLGRKSDEYRRHMKEIGHGVR